MSCKILGLRETPLEPVGMSCKILGLRETPLQKNVYGSCPTSKV